MLLKENIRCELFIYPIPYLPQNKTKQIVCPDLVSKSISFCLLTVECEMCF